MFSAHGVLDNVLHKQVVPAFKVDLSSKHSILCLTKSLDLLNDNNVLNFS